MNFIEKDIDKGIEGTLLNAELLEKANWRENDTLSFTKRTNDNAPDESMDKTQIYTKANGETWLLPPGNMRTPVQLGKTTGTTVKLGGVEQDSLEFSSDPQVQLEGLKSRASSLESRSTILESRATALETKTNELSSSSYLKSVILNAAYPVGAIYMSVTNTSPASFFGGTWTPWGQGRVPVGVGSNGETNYATAEQVGGSENTVAPHQHTFDHTHTVRVRIATATSTGSIANDYKNATSATNIVTNNSAAGMLAILGQNSGRPAADTSAQSANTTPNDIGVTGGNRQPFITCYMWKRTA